MSTSIIKVFFLLAVVVCISQAQRKFLYFLYVYFTLCLHHLQREACSVDRQQKYKNERFIFFYVQYVLVAVI